MTTTTVEPDSTNGTSPAAGLIADASGNLFGTTSGGGAKQSGDGVRDCKDCQRLCPHHAGRFNGTNGRLPLAALISDASGMSGKGRTYPFRDEGGKVCNQRFLGGPVLASSRLG